MQRNPESLKNLRRGVTIRGPSKTTKLVKDAILMAAEKAGGKGGMVGYLTTQAIENPAAFMGLMGKVLPLQLAGEDGGQFRLEVSWLPPSE